MAIRVEVARVVPSSRGKDYVVSKWVPGIGKFTDILDSEVPGSLGHVWECSCLSWTRNTPRSDCKHILRIKAWWDWTKKNLQVVPMTGVRFRIPDRLILDELEARRPRRMTSQEVGEEERMGGGMRTISNPARVDIPVKSPTLRVPCETCGVVHKKGQKWCKVTDVENKLAKEKEEANKPHRFKILEVD